MVRSVFLLTQSSFGYRYKQYAIKHNSMILLRCISYTVLFNDMFRLSSYEPYSGWLLLLVRQNIQLAMILFLLRTISRIAYNMSHLTVMPHLKLFWLWIHLSFPVRAVVNKHPILVWRYFFCLCQFIIIIIELLQYIYIYIYVTVSSNNWMVT